MKRSFYLFVQLTSFGVIILHWQSLLTLYLSCVSPSDAFSGLNIVAGFGSAGSIQNVEKKELSFIMFICQSIEKILAGTLSITETHEVWPSTYITVEAILERTCPCKGQLIKFCYASRCVIAVFLNNTTYANMTFYVCLMCNDG